MTNIENTPPNVSRRAELAAKIEDLRKVKIVNQSDPGYAAEIQDQIESFEEELRSLDS